MNNSMVMRETQIQLPDINQTTLSQWYIKRQKKKEQEILKQKLPQRTEPAASKTPLPAATASVSATSKLSCALSICITNQCHRDSHSQRSNFKSLPIDANSSSSCSSCSFCTATNSSKKISPCSITIQNTKTTPSASILATKVSVSTITPKAKRWNKDYPGTKDKQQSWAILV